MTAKNIHPSPALRQPRGMSARFLAALALACLLPAAAWAQVEVEVGTTGSVEAKPPKPTPVPATPAPAPTPASPRSDVPRLNQDAAADQAASKILPAPGSVLKSTENSSLGGQATTAPTPSLTFGKNDTVTVTTKTGTSETLAVKTGAELMRLLGLKRNPNAEKELESEITTTSLFDVKAVERLKGDKPTVVYRVIVDETPLPDPMIVPWIRQAKLVQERFDKAVDELATNKISEGRQDLMGIISDFPNTDYAKQAQELLKKMDELAKSNMPMPVELTPTPENTVQLSPDVKIGTVIVDISNPKDDQVMIANRVYQVGDSIKGIPGHKVVGISEKIVKIEVTQNGQTKVFDVPVRPVGMN